MTIDDIKEQVVRMEGFAEGFKNGGQIFAQWLIQTMEKEAQEKKD